MFKLETTLYSTRGCQQDYKYWMQNGKNVILLDGELCFHHTIKLLMPLFSNSAIRTFYIIIHVDFLTGFDILSFSCTSINLTNNFILVYYLSANSFEMFSGRQTSVWPSHHGVHATLWKGFIQQFVVVKLVTSSSAQLGHHWKQLFFDVDQVKLF